MKIKLEIKKETDKFFMSKYEGQTILIFKNSPFKQLGDKIFIDKHLADKRLKAAKNRQQAGIKKLRGLIDQLAEKESRPIDPREFSKAPPPDIKKLEPLEPEETEAAFKLMEENHRLFDTALIDKIYKAIAAGKETDDFYDIIEAEPVIKQIEIRRILRENTKPLTTEQKIAMWKNRPRGPEMLRGFDKGRNMTTREMIYQDRKNAAAVRKRENLEKEPPSENKTEEALKKRATPYQFTAKEIEENITLKKWYNIPDKKKKTAAIEKIDKRLDTFNDMITNIAKKKNENTNY